MRNNVKDSMRVVIPEKNEKKYKEKEINLRQN